MLTVLTMRFCVRFALNYKGLPYKTTWVEYPDIAEVCKEIGAAPTIIRPDGTEGYTLPAIYDPSTKTAVSESAMIARYLDKTYPDTPTLIPAETDAFHAAFQEAFLLTIQMKLSPIMLPHTAARLNPPSEAYFRRTREAMFGKKLEEFSPVGPIREGQWKEVQSGFKKLSEWMAADGKEKPFFMGNTVCYADLTIAGWLVWVKCILGADGEEWAAIRAWDGGKWAQFMQYFEKYEKVD